MPMNKIFVACSSSNNIDKKYIDLAKRLGEYINDKKLELIYGGSFGGEMTALGDAVQNKISVSPNHFEDVTDIKTENTCLTTYSMLNMADTVIILPGGIGSLMEATTMIHLKRIKELERRIILINYDNFFADLIDYFEKLKHENFFEDLSDYVEIVNDIDEIKD